MVVVVVFGTRVSEILGKLRVRESPRLRLGLRPKVRHECNMNASQPAALREES